ncbi:MAG: F0F1 ATP synthase subunit A [Opitutales bacterium]|nr:F0F1 ATP synthase subunit A [Opitutales bacterium]
MKFCNFGKVLKISVLLACAQLYGASATFASSVKADYLFDIYGLPITNSMFTTWIFTAVIIILFRLLIWKGAKLVPSCGQQIIESIIDGLRGIFEPLMGEKAFKGAFPLLLGFFSYILIMNWSGLLPGVGSIGLEQQADGTTKFVPFLRPANTDLNTTLALAIISFVAWIYFVGKYVGLKGFLKDTFGNKADKKEIALPIYFSLFFVFFAVGCIDIVSILMRLLSLSFRLFGNNFGGEVLLENMHHLAIDLPRWASWIIPIPFYLLEMLIGLIQAFLFSLLTAVYIGLLTGHEEHE